MKFPEIFRNIHTFSNVGNFLLTHRDSLQKFLVFGIEDRLYYVRYLK